MAAPASNIIKRIDVVITTACPICRAINNIMVPLAEFQAWMKGGNAYKAFKKVAPASKIELVVTGMCEECFTDWVDDLEDQEREQIKGRD